MSSVDQAPVNKAAAKPQATKRIGHSHCEDAFAILIGSLLVAFGAVALKDSGALTGGTAGMAFLAYYLTGVPFGVWFFVVNLPFYWLAIRRMGWEFTVKTFAAVGLVSLFSELCPNLLQIQVSNPVYATLFACIVLGCGFIVLFRHKASLGGVNILALYLQDRFGLRAGTFQMFVDSAIVLASLFIVDPWMLVVSIAGAIVVNLIIAVNFRKDRYLG